MTTFQVAWVAVVTADVVILSVFIGVYATRAWRSTEAGRSLMYKTIAAWFLLASVLASFLWPYPGSRWIHLAGLAAYGVANAVLLRVLVRAPRHPPPE